MTTYQDKQREIKEYCIERLKEIADYCGADDFKDYDVSELHNDIFNTDYYIVGRYQAKQWLGADAFDCIGDIQEYENLHFGECHTALSDPEQVVPMWVYLQGYEIIEECHEDVCNNYLDPQLKMEVA